jgi:hypothetical protein
MRRLLLALVIALVCLGAGLASPNTPRAQASQCDWDGATYISECFYFYGCNFKITRAGWLNPSYVFFQNAQITSCNSGVEYVRADISLNSGPGPGVLNGPWTYHSWTLGDDASRKRDRDPGTPDAPPPPANGSVPVAWDSWTACPWHGSRWESSKLWVETVNASGYHGQAFFSPIGEVYGMVWCA